MEDKSFAASIALQSVYQQRACPPDELLFAEKHSAELELHLGYCRHCQQRLQLTKEDRSAWQELGSRLLAERSINKSPGEPAPGQIWSLNRGQLGGWGPYDRYYTAPLVLVLQLQDSGRTVRVAQVCSEEMLQGDDGADVWLGGNIGFAESWNVFSVHRENLRVCREKVGKTLAAEVLAKSHILPNKVQLTPIIRQFRELEIQVGAFMAMQALPRVMEAVELATVEERELIPGLTAIFDEISQFGIRITGEALEVLRVTFAPQPAFSAARRSKTRSPLTTETLSPEVRKLLESNLPLMLSDAYLDPDGLKLKFKTFSNFIDPLAVLALYEKVIVVARWQKWDGKNPILHLPSIVKIPTIYNLKLENGTLMLEMEG